MVGALTGGNTWSVNLFDASWRDDGIRLLLNCGVSLSGTAAALLRERRGRQRRAPPQFLKKRADPYVLPRTAGPDPH